MNVILSYSLPASHESKVCALRVTKQPPSRGERRGARVCLGHVGGCGPPSPPSSPSSGRLPPPLSCCYSVADSLPCLPLPLPSPAATCGLF
ncbi:hypothetical protein E2C01_036763 [Portunus trituberculatus]|uniref:Uncharacterized protein n=1 Tax=Portunus trituberculatus TaxID=210409 RepID=A0A5B7FCU9_PORTR|nr:hypothetical protein [Portunus trituberculatus]